MEPPVPPHPPATQLLLPSLPKYPYAPVQCQALWSSLSLSQQQAIFRQVVTICLQLASEAPDPPQKEAGHDDQ